MKHLFIYTLLLTHLVLAVDTAHAGAESGGGGGNVIVCFNSTDVVNHLRQGDGYITDDMLSAVSSIEAYDLFEARQPHGMAGEVLPEILEIEAGENVIDYATRALERLYWLSPNLYGFLNNAQLTFHSERIIMQPFGVRKVDDVNSVSLIDSARCVMTTMAHQYFANNETFLHLDARLFNHPLHSRLSQGVLILHEIIYAAARRFLNHTDSSATRSLVGYIISTNQDISARDVLTTARSLGFETRRFPLRVFPQSYLRTAMVHFRAITEHMTFGQSFLERINMVYVRCESARNILQLPRDAFMVDGVAPTLDGCLRELRAQSRLEEAAAERVRRLISDLEQMFIDASALVETALRAEWSENLLGRLERNILMNREQKDQTIAEVERLMAIIVLSERNMPLPLLEDGSEFDMDAYFEAAALRLQNAINLDLPLPIITP